MSLALDAGILAVTVVVDVGGRPDGAERLCAYTY